MGLESLIFSEVTQEKQQQSSFKEATGIQMVGSCCLSRLRKYRDTSYISLSAETNVLEAEMTPFSELL